MRKRFLGRLDRRKAVHGGWLGRRQSHYVRQSSPHPTQRRQEARRPCSRLHALSLSGFIFYFQIKKLELFRKIYWSKARKTYCRSNHVLSKILCISIKSWYEVTWIKRKLPNRLLLTYARSTTIHWWKHLFPIAFDHRPSFFGSLNSHALPIQICLPYLSYSSMNTDRIWVAVDIEF